MEAWSEPCSGPHALLQVYLAVLPSEQQNCPSLSLIWEGKGGTLSASHRKSRRSFRPGYLFSWCCILCCTIPDTAKVTEAGGWKAVLGFSLSQQLVRQSLIAVFILALVESEPFDSKLLPWHLNLSGRLLWQHLIFLLEKEGKKSLTCN